MPDKTLFDEWPERYQKWFATPIGKLVKKFETELILELLELQPNENLLDAGCGTGIFTLDFLARHAYVVGLDISRPMLNLALKKTTEYHFTPVQSDMLYLPFKDNSFDKAISITALEFIEEAKSAVDELFRVTRPGGIVVVATLNSLSLWAARRNAKTQKGQSHILENAIYRSPDQLLALSSLKGIVKTVIHFQKDDNLARAVEIERSGQSQKLDTGAFVAVKWIKIQK